MKKVILDKIVYGVAQGLAIFGLLMFLFVPMLSVSITVLSSNTAVASVTIIDFLGSIEFDSGNTALAMDIVILAMFVLTMILALVAVINLIVALTSHSEMKGSATLTFAILAFLFSLAMFIVINRYIAQNTLENLSDYISEYLSDYITVSTGWIGSLIVCVVALLIPIIYINAIRPNVKFAADDEEAQPKNTSVGKKNSAAHSDMDTIEAIKAYKQLLDDGAITAEEYEKKKAELLK